ncbi:craniofacial development protein 2-like [Temnothorax longispinosus]|uniref:craniofacial development protein 2-like n=1 Tax=Temnothorax longispinosus TaxID=300112 RepID=UPI003A9A2A77
MEMTFGMKSRTRFGTWNIRTMLETSRLAQVIHEMDRYRLQVLGLCETRWPEQGEHITSDGHMLLFSGKPTNELRASSVGILLNSNTRRGLINWKPVTDGIIWVRLRSKVTNITFIQCYAPTEVSDEESKNVFYEQLTATIRDLRKSDIVVLMGDFNAKVGQNNSRLEHVMGAHALGQMNNNGELLIEFWSTQGLIIRGSIFPHKDIHKATWISPDNRTMN